MDRITIWLADENEHYVELVKRYIRTSHYKNKLSITAYTDDECFKHSLEHIHSETIVLVSGLFLPICSELTELTELTVIILSEEVMKEAEDHPNQVFKYRPLNQMLDQVLNIYYGRKKHILHSSNASENKLRVIATYSASGGSGVTTTANQLSKFCASLGKKVFYLNLETIHGMLSSSSDSSNTRFTQVLYMIKSGQPLLGKLDQLLAPDYLGQYDMFHPARYSREWLEYEREDIQLLLTALERTGRYDIIIMDVGSSLFSTTIGALEFADEILWIIPDRPGSIGKIEYVRTELGRISVQLLNDINNRSKYILQLCSSLQVMMSFHNNAFDGILPYVIEWQQNNPGAPPAPYRQALLRLIGIQTDEEMIPLEGEPAGGFIHRPT